MFDQRKSTKGSVAADRKLWSKKASQPEYVTFKEKRERERRDEQANLGPGSTSDHIKPFGSDVRGGTANFGPAKKSIYQRESSPSPGEYDVDAGIKATKPRGYEAHIVGKGKDPKIDPTPGPYDYDQKQNYGNVGFGSKYDSR